MLVLLILCSKIFIMKITMNIGSKMTLYKSSFTLINLKTVEKLY